MQVADVGRVTQLAKRLRPDLADAFAGDAELAAHFFERAGIAVDEAEARFEHSAVAFGEVSSTSRIFSLSKVLAVISEGFSADLSSMKSPKVVSSLSPTWANRVGSGDDSPKRSRLFTGS